MTTKISPYVLFATKYCDYKNMFTVNPISKQKEYDGCDIWEGILQKYDHENRNRGNKGKLLRGCK